MSALTYLADSVPWTCVGLLAGYLLGRGVRELESSAAKELDMNERKPRFRFGGIQLLGAVVFLLAVGTVAQGYVQGEQTKRVAECTRGYSNGFAAALDARSEANSQAQQALDDLMTEIGQLANGVATPQSREQFREALADYLTKRAEAKKQQQENPYPPAPRDVCN